MAQLGKFQMTNFQHWKGLTKENHLGSIFGLEPQKASPFMIRLLAMYRGKNTETYLSQFPIKVFETDDEYVWEAIGSSRRNIALVEARNENGIVITSGIAGINGAPIYLVFPEDWFSDGNVIVGEKNEAYPFRILGEARMEGSNAVYKTELMGAVKSVPAEELESGKRFSVEYSPVEKELSRGVGDVRFTSAISMRNEWSRLRIKHKVPGSMLDKKLAIGIPVIDNMGNKRIDNKWMFHVEYQLEEQFSDEKNNLIMYGRSNRNQNGEYLNFGKSGNVLKMGAGLREQMELSNVIYYNKFDIKLITDALYSLSASKLGFSDRVFILKTGEYGALQFHQAVEQEVNGWQSFKTNTDALGMVQRTSSPLHGVALSAGYQFTEYRAPNGCVVKVEVDPIYDDEVRNKILHPNGGVAESYRYDILYIGSADQPNIQLAKLRGQEEIRGFQAGLRNPFTGETNNMNMSFDEDSAIIHRMWTGGVFILDPTRTMSIIPAILG